MEDIADLIDNITPIPCTSTNDPELVRRLLLTNPTLKIFSMNIRSIKKNFDELLILLTDLGSDFDIIVLSECWIQENFIPKTIRNYNHYNTLHNQTQNDGVIVYIKNHVTHSVKEIKIKNANCLQIQLDDHTTLLTMYRSPNTYNITPFIHSLHEILSSIEHCQNTFIIGDLNINIINKMHPQANEYLNTLTLLGYFPAVTAPTRESIANNSSCIDHVFIKSELVSKSIVYQSTVTDHYAIITSLSQKNHKSPPITSPQEKISYETLLNHVSKENWEPIYSCTDVTSACDLFINTLRNHLADATSYTKSKRNRSDTKLKPWITAGILHCIRKRDKIHNFCRKNPNDYESFLFYKRYRNICKKIIANVKRDYYQKQISEATGDKKKIWNIIKDIADINKTNTPIVKINIEDQTLNVNSDPKKISDHFNQFFSNIGANLAKNILDRYNVSEKDLANNIPASNLSYNPFYFTPSTETEILDLISSLKNSNSAGIDHLSTKNIKHIQKYIASPLKHIINLSFKTGIFPNSLKQATVIPIFKTGDKLSVNNYRPISLLSPISKIIEKAVKNRLYKFLEDNKILSDNQYGFRKGRSTSDAIAALTKIVSYNLDLGRKPLAVFLDLAKAFDTVSHPLLLKKLQQIGITGIPYTWFESYLTNRTQQTLIHSDKTNISKKLSMSYGVPQGSVLGPLLFLIYINTLCSMDIGGKILSFADDTVLIFEDEAWQSVINKTNIGLIKVRHWLDTNLLTLNIDKTQYMTFSIRKHNFPNNCPKPIIHSCSHNINTPETSPNINCTCLTLKSSKEVKYLGIIIDDQLRWEAHISDTVKRLRKLCHIFCSLRSILDLKTLRSVYFALFQSIATYGIMGWGGCSESVINPIITVQKLILRIIFKCQPTHPSNVLFTKIRVLDIRQLFTKTSLSYIRKTNLLVAPQHQVHTRFSSNLGCVVPKTRTTFAQRQFWFIAPKIYNALSTDIKSTLAISLFTIRVQHWIFEMGRAFFKEYMTS